MKSNLIGLLKYLGGVKVIREKDIEKIKNPEKKEKARQESTVFNKKALDYCRFLYAHGEIIIVHAEGTRTKGYVNKLDRGMFIFTKMMERRLGFEIPVIPVGIEYENLWVPRSRVYIRAGKPISSKNPNLIETVRKEIRKLSNL